MKFFKHFLLFLIINFGALGLGILLMGNGPTSDWYTSLNQAPWTPPNGAFGISWTLIMICFSIFMTLLYIKSPTHKVIWLFVIQFLLNVAWNFVFFNQHLVTAGLVVILGLTFVVTVFLFSYLKLMKAKTLLILPYFIWICIASSLNLYIFLNN